MKKILPAIIIIVLLLIAGGVYFLGSKSKNNTAAPSTAGSTQNENQNSAAKQGVKESLKSLLSSGTAQKCSYKDDSENVNIAGVAYISAGKMRGDFSTKIQDQTANSHMIYDGKTSYIWSDGTANGIKMEVDINAAAPTGTETDTNNSQGIDMNKTFDYECTPWVVDQSQFTPPANVTFSEFAIPTISLPAKENQEACASCNSLTGTAKTQCMTMLNCK